MVVNLCQNTENSGCWRVIYVKINKFFVYRFHQNIFPCFKAGLYLHSEWKQFQLHGNNLKMQFYFSTVTGIEQFYFAFTYNLKSTQKKYKHLMQGL